MGSVMMQQQLAPSPSFEDLRPRLQAVARAITRNQHDAEDVVQEVWLRYATQELEVVSPSRWLVTVTTNAAIDVLRRRGTRHEVTLPRGLDETLPEAAPDPAEQLEGCDRLRHGVERMLACLSPAERVALVGRDFAALTYAELSGGMRRSEVAVRQLHHRATVHLRAGLRRYPGSAHEVDGVLGHLREFARTGDVHPLLTRVGAGQPGRSDVTSAWLAPSTWACSRTSSW